jgi:hypothetical protein
MKILLRHTETGLYFQGTEKWTASLENAYDFRSVARAWHFVRIWELENVEVAFALEGSQPISTLAVGPEFRDAA